MTRGSTGVYQLVLSAARSPLNKRRWLCQLNCGHEHWIMAARVPKRTHCEECIVRRRREAAATAVADQPTETETTNQE